MKRILIIVISILAGTAVMLGAVVLLLFAAIQVDAIQMTVLRVGARIATLVLGVVVMVGATFVSTHLVVRLFRLDAGPPSSTN